MKLLIITTIIVYLASYVPFDWLVCIYDSSKPVAVFSKAAIPAIRKTEVDETAGDEVVPSYSECLAYALPI